jgi:pimeloyl-ACP methyl ester carboxylesterase
VRPPAQKDRHTHVPGAQFTVVAKAAHSINWEHPEACNRNVLDFIRKH